jgi:hypothetical protein
MLRRSHVYFCAPFGSQSVAVRFGSCLSLRALPIFLRLRLVIALGGGYRFGCVVGS